MTAHPNVTPEATGVDATGLEEALEAVPAVARACVARRDDRGTVVFVALESGASTFATDPGLSRELDRALAARGHDPAHVTVRLVPGWLPGRDAFPGPVRSRCVRARYSHLLVTGLAPITVTWALAT